MAQILIIDDNPAVCEALSTLVRVHGHHATTATSADEALARAAAQPFDVAIQDMNFEVDATSGNDGKALFAELRRIDADLPIILLTAWTQLEHAVELVKAGAADYLAKPWDDAKLITAIGNLAALSDAKRATTARNRKREAARAELAERYDLLGTVYASDAMHQAISLACNVAHSDVPVLITGPNGAGKERIAEIVQANSAVADKPFIRVNAGAIPSELMSAELFGAESGAYTGATRARQGRFEAADGGTLFLDEIGTLDHDSQVKLLRVLQTGEFERLGSNRTQRVNVRVISATNVDLPAAIRSGDFREDLYYRINVIEVALPPLTDRPDDILPLAKAFLGADFALSKPAQDALRRHHWPGNVRELSNCLRRAQLLAQNGLIEPTDLGLSDEPEGVAPLKRSEIADALEASDGVMAEAARALGLSRQALYRRMDKLGMR